MKKEKYCVMQGNCTECGTGDYWEFESFDNLKKAKKCMHAIFTDTNGIDKFHNGYLETLIIREKDEINEDEDLDEDDEYEIVDGMVYYY